MAAEDLLSTEEAQENGAVGAGDATAEVERTIWSGPAALLRATQEAVMGWAPEFALALLVHQASYQTVTVAGFRVSYLVFLAGVLLVAWALRRESCAFSLLREPKTYAILAPMAAFLAYYAASSLWSPWPLFGAQRAVKAAAVGALGAGAGLLFAARPERIWRLAWSILGIGLVVAVIGLIFCALTGWHRSLPSVFGVKYGVQAKSVGMAWIICLGVLFYASERQRGAVWKVAAVALLLAFVTFASLQSGSRSLVAVLVVLGLPLLLYGLTRPALRSGVAFAAAATFLGTVVFLGSAPPNSKALRQYSLVKVAQNRSPLPTGSNAHAPNASRAEPTEQNPAWHLTIRQMFGLGVAKQAPRYRGKAGSGVEADLSFRERLGLAHAALALFKRHPVLGAGAGGYYAHTHGAMAHNAVLELMAEAGILGVVLLAILCLQVLVMGRSGRGTRPGEAFPREARDFIWLVIVYAIVRAQFGTFFDEDRLLFLLGPMLVISRLRTPPAPEEA
jgi:O-antigen ligase